jgi:hypothetical protein
MAYWDEVLGQVPEGLIGSAQGMYDVATNPLQAAQGVGYYAMHPQEAAARAYGHYARRYKNLPTAMETFRQNPVSVAEDLLPLAALRGLAKKGAKSGAKKGAQEAARREIAGPAAIEGEVISPLPQIGYMPPEPVPAAPYYRNVPPEMGTSMRPMTPFQQNQVGLSTGRFGAQGYAPEIAVTDFESYAPGGRGRTTTGPTPMNKFDQNMMDAYFRGRMSTGASRGLYGEYTPEEMGSAIVPYRQGGLVYEPVGGPQGAAPRQIGGPQSGGLPTMAQGRGMRPTLIEGEFSEVPPQGQIPYGMGYRPNFTMEGGTYTPSMGAAEQFGAGTQRGYRGFGPLGAGLGLAAGPGVMYMADRTERPVSSLSNNPMQPSNVAPASPLYGTSPEGYPTFGIMPGAEGMNFINRARQGAGPEMPKGAGRRAAGGGAAGGGQKAVPLPPTRPEGLGDTGWEGNLNYLVTSLIDRISGQGEAERGRNTQEYYATNPWPY